MEIEIELINRQVIGMSRKAKLITNVQKCINESKPNNTNIDFNVNQLKTINMYRVVLLTITLLDFDTILKNL